MDIDGTGSPLLGAPTPAGLGTGSETSRRFYEADERDDTLQGLWNMEDFDPDAFDNLGGASFLEAQRYMREEKEKPSAKDTARDNYGTRLRLSQPPAPSPEESSFFDASASFQASESFAASTILATGTSVQGGVVDVMGTQSDLSAEDVSSMEAVAHRFVECRRLCNSASFEDNMIDEPSDSDIEAMQKLLGHFALVCDHAKRAGDDTFESSVGRRLRDIRRKALKDERDTWELLVALKMRYVQSAGEGVAVSSEQDAIDAAFKDDEDLEYLHRLTSWLQHLAAEDAPQVMREQEIHAWGRTARKLRSGVLSGKADPDAPLRGDIALDRDDAMDELAMLRSLWKLVRAGAFYVSKSTHSNDATNLALTLCASYGQHWRAASLSGGAPLAVEVREGVPVQSGNANRLLWKEMCFRLCKKLLRENSTASANDVVEGAIHAILSCSPDHACNVASLVDSWHAAAWVRFRCAAQCRIDRVLQNFRDAQASMTSFLPGCCDDDSDIRMRVLKRCAASASSTANSIIAELKRSENHHVRDGAATFYATVQAALIQGSFGSVLEAQLMPLMHGAGWQHLIARTIRELCGDDFADGIDGIDDVSSSSGDGVSQSATSVRDSAVDAARFDMLRFIASAALFFSAADRALPGAFDGNMGVLRNDIVVGEHVKLCALVAFAREMLAKRIFVPLPHYTFRLRGSRDALCEAAQVSLLGASLETFTPAPHAVRIAIMRLTCREMRDGDDEVTFAKAIRQCCRNARRRLRKGSKAPPSYLKEYDRFHAYEFDDTEEYPCIEDNTQSDDYDTLEQRAGYESIDEGLWKAICGIQWAGMHACTRLSQIVEANAVIRHTVLSGVDARALSTMRVLITGILPDHALEMLSDGQLQSGVAAANALKELKCWKAYLQARDTLDEWRASVDRRSRELQEIDNAIQSTGLQGARGRLLVRKYQDELAAGWNDISEAIDKVVVDAMNVLKFQGGWLCDEGSNEESFDNDSMGGCDAVARRELLARVTDVGTMADPGPVRRTCIPALILLLHAALFESADWILRRAPKSPQYCDCACAILNDSINLRDHVQNNTWMLHRTFSEADDEQFVRSCRKAMSRLNQVQGEDFMVQ